MFPLCGLKRCDLTLLRLRCLWWAVLVSVSLTVSPMQKVSFLQLYNMETFYLELLFLAAKQSTAGLSAFGRECDNKCMGLCLVLYFWSAQAVSR